MCVCIIFIFIFFLVREGPLMDDKNYSIEIKEFLYALLCVAFAAPIAFLVGFSFR